MGNTCSARPCSGCCCCPNGASLAQRVPSIPQDAGAPVVAAEHPAGEVTGTSRAHDQGFSTSSATTAASIRPTTTTTVAAAAKVTFTNRISGEASTSSSSSAYHAHQSILAKDGIDAELDLVVADIRAHLAFAKESHSSSSCSPKPNATHWKIIDSVEISKIKDFFSESADAVSSSSHSIAGAAGGDVLMSVATTLLNGVGKAHWVAAGLVAVGFVLERVHLISSNKSECIHLLNEMVQLAEYLHKMKQMPKIKEQLATSMEKASRVIFQGTFLCLSQCKASKFSKFLAAHVHQKHFQELKEDIKNMYRNLTFELQLYNVQENVEVFPRKEFYPCHAVFPRESLENVKRLLELESDNKAVAVIVYGFGGIGKTTLANAVYARLEDVDDFRFCRAELYHTGESKPNLTKVQKKIRDAILQEETTEPESPTQGQRLLLNCLDAHSCVIYLDNVLGTDELAQCLPRKLSSYKKLRLLITARDASVQDGLSIPNVKLFGVDLLPDEEAQNVLKTYMEDDASTEISEIDQHDVAVNICGGVPLLIELVGRCILHNKDKAKALQVARDERTHSPAEWFGGRNVDILSFAFNDLPEYYQHAFLPICAFFSSGTSLWLNMERIFGADTMKLLENRALVKSRWQYSKYAVNQAGTGNTLQVHDVILKMARDRYMDKRISSISQFQGLPQLPSTRINEVLGVYLEKTPKERLQLSCESLDAMSSSLRIFSSSSIVSLQSDAIEIQGECKGTFSRLIYWRSPLQKPPFKVSECRELRYLAFATTSTVELDTMPPSLVMLKVNYVGPIEGPAITVRVPEQVPKIEVLGLGGEHLTEIPVGVLPNISSLSVLCIYDCKRLKEVPDDFHSLDRLRHILLMNVPLQNFPQSIGKCVRCKISHLASETASA